MEIQRTGRNSYLKGILLGLATAMFGCQETLQYGTQQDLQQLLQRQIADGDAPGIAVGIIKRGQEPVFISAGKANIHRAEKMTAGTVAAWFSVTKLFTATVILHLVEQNHFKLDQPISRYLSIPELGATADNITIRHLLNHTSGLPNPIPVQWIHLADEPGPPLESFTRGLLARHKSVDEHPGKRFRYSNLGYLILGLLIERVSEGTYQTAVDNIVLRALAMRNSGFILPENAATGYQCQFSWMGIASRFILESRFFGNTISGFTALRPFLVDGAPYGGLTSTAEDMARFAAFWLEPDRFEELGVLDRKTATEALVPSKNAQGQEIPMGLGWHLGTIEGHPYATHLGGGGGYKSEVRIYPKLGQGVVVIANETSYDTAPVTEFILL